MHGHGAMCQGHGQGCMHVVVSMCYSPIFRGSVHELCTKHADKQSPPVFTHLYGGLCKVAGPGSQVVVAWSLLTPDRYKVALHGKYP